MDSASHWLKGIKTYRLLWYLTRVSANHALNNWALGPVVRKPINANPRLRVNRGFHLADTSVFKFKFKFIKELNTYKEKISTARSDIKPKVKKSQSQN